jgi:hypothetical protein
VQIAALPTRNRDRRKEFGGLVSGAVDDDVDFVQSAIGGTNAVVVTSVIASVSTSTLSMASAGYHSLLNNTLAADRVVRCELRT